MNVPDFIFAMDFPATIPTTVSCKNETHLILTTRDHGELTLSATLFPALLVGDSLEIRTLDPGALRIERGLRARDILSAILRPDASIV